MDHPVLRRVWHRLGQLTAWGVVSCSFATGCGSEASIGEIGVAANEAPANEGGEVTDNLPDWAANANRATGHTALDYPAAPYGNTQGSIVADQEFAGWTAPAAAGYEPTASSVLRFSDFYDPDNTKDIEFLLVNAVAVWCGVCQLEYQDLDDAQLYQQLRPRGVQMLGILFEDQDGGSPKYSDLTNWGKFFKVEFPFVLDPSFASGIYFDRSATPMNMLIDAKTMQIVWVTTGYYPDSYERLDELLKQRGR